MSDRPSYTQSSPPEKLNGIVADTSPAGERGWKAPVIFQVPGASVTVPGARHGELEVRNRRGRLQAGANAPKTGRAPGGPRPQAGHYTSDPLTWGTRILSLETPNDASYAPENLPWLGNRDAMDPAVVAQATREWEEDTAELLNDGVLLQQERFCAEQFFGSDLAGTSCEFDNEAVSGSAFNPSAGLSFDDPEFDFVGFIAKVKHELHRRMGVAVEKVLTVIVGEETAVELEANLGLLGIKVIGDSSNAVTSQMSDGRLTSEGLTTRIQSLSGVARFIRCGAVYDNSLVTAASQNNDFVWANGLWVGLIGGARPRVNAVTRNGGVGLSVLDTSVLEIINKAGKFRAKLTEDELLMKAWAEKIIGYKVVNGDFGMTFFNS